MSSPTKEFPLASLLPALLKCEGFSDVKLEGTDGDQVGANRHVLAHRSEVFDKLLCGQFQESNAPIVKFDYSSDVLQAVVEYCYTDKAELLQDGGAADYFGLNVLLEQRPTHKFPLASVLPALLKDGRSWDVKLEGNDGIQVDANRFVLGGRSPQLHKLLCHQFQEADAPIVKFDYSSAVLKAVVEYCYTDTPELLKDVSAPVTIASLMHAANYFGLDGLLQKTKTQVYIMYTGNSSALPFFLACKTFGNSKEIQELALKALHNAPLLTEELDEDMLARMDSSVLELILKDNDMQTTEYALFCLLKAWVDVPGVDSIQRREEARHLVQHIRLENVATEDLASVVKPSGLVASAQLMTAYEVKCLRHNDPPAFQQPRYKPASRVWKHAQTSLLSGPVDILSHRTVTNIIDCPPMKVGIHSWTLKVEHPSANFSIPSSFEVGVMLLSEFDRTQRISRNRSGWAFMSNGARYHASVEILPKLSQYSSGSTVTFTLDLRPGNGTLVVSIDDGDSFEVFNNMLQVEEVRSMGLIPAASIHVSGGNVEFLGFHYTVEYN